MRLALSFPRIDPTRGGAETYIVDLCRGLIHAGHQVDLYAEGWKQGTLPPEVRCIAVETTGATRLQRLWNFACNEEIALRGKDYDCTVGFINTWGHDVIIPQGGVHGGSLRANSRRFRTRLMRKLYVLGKMLNPKYATYQAIERRQYAPERQTRVVAVSHMVRRHIQEFHQVPRPLIHVVPNAIDPERVLVAHPGAVRCAFRNRLGFEPEDTVGLFAGHNFSLKGLKELLGAMGRCRKSGGRPLHLIVCGGGNVKAYRRIAASHDLADRVHFLGFHPDIRECYAASDFFALPTYYDPCSLVVLEALASGLPVITTAQNGASELMTNGRHGFVLSAPNARGELVEALHQMTDNGRRQAMSVEASRLGREQTFDRHVASLIKVFEEVAAARNSHGGHGRHAGSKPHLEPSRSNRTARH
jgi:UDP-glucose:(heptosyl)LPS alpha-1,3-glucosyltransferase